MDMGYQQWLEDEKGVEIVAREMYKEMKRLSFVYTLVP